MAMTSASDNIRSKVGNTLLGQVEGTAGADTWELAQYLQWTRTLPSICSS